MKRLFDFTSAMFGLILLSPVLLFAMLAVWLQDFCSPFYIAPRVGKNSKEFRMVKLRSMVMNADKTGVDSTSNTDRRITRVGSIIRRFKLDEITQLWNVLVGDMSLVGPRPNVRRETDLYTDEEKKLLSVKPGITDFASIVFSDEGDILSGSDDPDLSYHQLIRPGKGHLGLFYVQKASFWLDLKLIIITLVAIVSRKHALMSLAIILEKLEAPDYLKNVARRDSELVPSPPPGASEVVMYRGY